MPFFPEKVVLNNIYLETTKFQNKLFIITQAYLQCSFSFEELNRYAVEKKTAAKHGFLIEPH
jgi:hypothetical protein